MGTIITGSTFPTGSLTSGTTNLAYINIPQAGVWLINAVIQLNYTGTLTGYFGFGGAIPSSGIGLSLEIPGASSASGSVIGSISVSQITIAVTFSGGAGVTLDPNCFFKATRIG